MAGASESGHASRTSRRAVRALRAVALVLSALLLVLAAGGYLAYRHYVGRIGEVSGLDDLSSLLDDPAVEVDPALQPGEVRLLLGDDFARLQRDPTRPRATERPTTAADAGCIA